MKKVVAVVSSMLLSFSLFACSSAPVDTVSDDGEVVSESGTQNSVGGTFVPKFPADIVIGKNEISPVVLSVGDKDFTFGKTTLVDVINDVYFKRPFFREVDSLSDDSGNVDGDASDFSFMDAVGIEGKESNLLQQLETSSVELKPGDCVSLRFRVSYIPKLDDWTNDSESEESVFNVVDGDEYSAEVYDYAECYWQFIFEKATGSSKLEDAVLAFAHVEGDFTYFDLNENDETEKDYLNSKSIMPEIRFADKNLVLGDVSGADIDYIFSEMGVKGTVFNVDEPEIFMVKYPVSSGDGDMVYCATICEDDGNPILLDVCDKAHEPKFLF